MEGLVEHATGFGASPATGLTTFELWALMVTACMTAGYAMRIAAWFKRNVYQIFDRLWPEPSKTKVVALRRKGDVDSNKKD